MRFYTRADIVGTGAAAAALNTLFSQTKAKEIIISVVAGSTAPRFGDSGVGAAQGVPITTSTTANPTILRTTVADETDFFDLAQCYLFIPNGTTVAVAIGV